MNKSDIIEHLYKRGYPRYSEDKLSKEEVKKIVITLFNCIGREVAVFGARVEIRGFGMFSLRKKAAGFRRNPCHNVSFSSDETYRIYFKPGKNLKEKIKHSQLRNEDATGSSEGK